MKVENLKEAISEAERFLEIAGQVKIKKVVGTHQAAGKTWLVVEDYTKETAACKRASMDLTRALAKLRNG